MKINRNVVTVCMSSALLYSCGTTPQLDRAIDQALNRSKQPNFVTIVIDDMGYSDLRMFGGEVPAPNLEQLAANSVLLSNFYAAPSSSPSRAMLFTGKDNHAVGMGRMKESMREEQAGLPNYSGMMSLDALPFTELLQHNGYNTMMTGKWHLGGHEEGEEAYYPYNRGFTQTKGVLLPGGDMTYLTGAQGEFITEHPHMFGGRTSLYNENGHESDLSHLPPYTIGEVYYTDSAIEMLNNWKASPQQSPFYLNMSYVAPHQPLQAPKEVVDSLVPIYAVGWDKIRQQRFENLKAQGLLPANTVLPPMPANVPAWDSLSDRNKAYEARRMAVYAGELKVLDDNIGRLVQHLRDIGAYENTVFIVYSDNGASNTSFGHMPKNFTKHDYTPEQLAAMTNDEFNKMLADMGSAYSWLGPNTEWATVSGMPHRGVKGDTYDGGIVGAAFLAYPGVTQGTSINNCLWSVMDVAPTILDMAGIEYPTTYKGKANKPMDGISMARIFKGDNTCDTNRWLGFEVDGVKGLRYGDWKLAQAWNDANVRMFNVRADPFERNDLATTNPGKFAELQAIYAQYAIRNNIIDVNTQHLPNLADANKTTAKIRGGTSWVDPDGNMYFFKNEAAFAKMANIAVAGEVRPEADHRGKAGTVYAEIIATSAQGRTKHYFVTESGGIIKGVAGSKTPFAHFAQLPEMILVPIYEGAFAKFLGMMNPEPVALEFVLGYQLDNGVAIDNGQQGKKMTLAVSAPKF